MKQPEMEKQPQSEKLQGEGKPELDKPAGIVQPMIDELRYPKDAPEPPKAPPRGPVHPPEPGTVELDQDPGGGYNPDGTFPQT